MIISEEILNKIKYLCKNIPKVEWSGVLFYSVKGSIKEPKKMEIMLEDILPLDMGTSTYTSYELDDRFTDYLLVNPKAMEWNVGHIHSHNVMNVFFSTTDLAELNDNAISHNYYLSLIVNNYMDFVAKVAFVGGTEKVVKQIPYLALDENGEQYTIQKVDLNYKKEKLFVYDCTILSTVEKIVVEDEFADKVAEIMKPKPLPSPVYKTTQNPTVNTFTSNFSPDKRKVQKVVSKPAKYNKIFSKTDASELSSRAKTIHSIAEKIPFNSFEDLSNFNRLNPLEKFTAELMNFTNSLTANENLEDVLTALEDMELDAYEIATSVISNYAIFYDICFPNSENKKFIDDTDEVICILEDYLLEFPFINVSIKALKAMITNFKKNDKTTI